MRQAIMARVFSWRVLTPVASMLAVACSAASPDMTHDTDGGSASGASGSTTAGSRSSGSGGTSFGGSSATSTAGTSGVPAGDGGSAVDGAVGDSSLPPLSSGPLDLKLPLDAPNGQGRQEWDTDVGWCGEQSISTVGALYGAYISQFVARAANANGTNVGGSAPAPGHPIVFGDGTSEQALGHLHFRYDAWDYASASDPSFQDFMVWMKGYLARGIPTIFSEYVHDHSNPPDPDYDHLVPGIGIKTSSANSAAYDPTDVLYFNTNEQTSVAVAFGALPAARTFASGSTTTLTSDCTVESYLGGCVPLHTDYGVAVTGILADSGSTVPVRLVLKSSTGTEPNPTAGESPKMFSAQLLVSDLNAGQKYTLLRYDVSANNDLLTIPSDLAKVPDSGSASSYLSSKFDARVDFTATGATWTYDDPQTFLSDSAVFYRCVPN